MAPFYCSKSASILVIILFASVALVACVNDSTNQRHHPRYVGEVYKDIRWPNRQINLLIDAKSFNSSEKQIIGSLLDQLEHKTCLKVNELSSERVSPFAPKNLLLKEEERNFVYMFKSPRISGQPSIGLSSFGCMRQGRQSVVLTDLAFKWPDLVLRYHLLRTLGVNELERPDGQVHKLLNTLPLSQKISSNEYTTTTTSMNSEQGSANFVEFPTYFAFATNSDSSKAAENISVGSSQQQVAYLSDEDLAKIKVLYDCADYQNRLSPKPLNKLSLNKNAQKIETQTTSSTIGSVATTDASTTLFKRLKLDESSSQFSDEDFEKLSQMFGDNSTSHRRSTDECKPLESCPLRDKENLPVEGPFDAEGNSLHLHQQQRERPMILKLDEFHALDPDLRQANQMKLSQKSIDSLSDNRLMNNPLGTDAFWPSDFPTQTQESSKRQQPKSEMLISFEQSSPAKDPLTALSTSQVLKLCSCTCQTMTPQGASTGASTMSTPSPLKPVPNDSELITFSPIATTPSPAMILPSIFPPVYPTEAPIYPTYPTSFPIYPSIRPILPIDDYDYTLPPTWPPVTMLPPWPTSGGDENDYDQSSDMQPTGTPPPFGSTTDTDELDTTTAITTSTTTPQPVETTTSFTTAANTTHSEETDTSTFSTTPLALTASACDLVEWVKPNKTVYASARIVWDVDRANQNYFLCSNELNGELVPGKTHGFACKISQEGKAFETHQFKVLTKPEHVNLAWVARNSNSFGRTNFPVVGGHSKNLQESYIVARCLVKDENNDVITLIGYINNHGIGWFPFDDIQIECSQYDVLACVN